MRWSSLIGVGALLATSQALIACGDSDSNGDNTGGSGGSSTSGAGGMNKGGSTSGGAGASTGGGGTSAGTFSMAGTAGTDMVGGEAGMATGGTGGMPECTKDLDCFDDFNVCTDEKCMDGKCQHVPNTADCTDNNPCTDDKCDAGTCKSTNNTAACDDKNDCTDNDMCNGGTCKGTNNTKDCDDLTTCTTGDKCTDGACKGTRDLNACPACDTPDNLIKNCDFSKMLDSWATGITFDGGAATQMVVNEHDVVSITAGGPAYGVQPRQEMVPLEQGFKYEIGLVAGASVARTVQFWMVQNGGNYTPYSDNGTGPKGSYLLDLGPQMKPFKFTFFMKYPDDPAAKFEIDAGGDGTYPADFYMDDAYLRKVKCAVPADCDDGNACTDDACDAGTGKCSWTNNTASPAACDDKNDCTVDACDAGACGHTAKADNVACDSDGQACSIEACSMGVCKVTDDSACSCSVDKDCDDKNPCTDDTCDGGVGAGGAGAGGASGGGTCVHTNNTASCADNDVCTVNNTCDAGACGAGTNVCFNCATADNLVANCDFTTNLNNWTPGFYGGAGNADVENGMMAVNITSSGSDPYMVQPWQGGIALTKGVHYLVKFNAYDSAGARDAVVSLTQNGGAYTSYSGPQIIHLTKEMQLFTFEFDMTADFPGEGVKFEFDLGGTGDNPTVPNTVFIDNVYIAPKL